MTWLSNLLQQACNKISSWIPAPLPSQKKLARTLIVAHRGAWKERALLENSLEAFKACLNTSIGAIEFDVRWTSDNRPVIHHDPSTGRLFQKDLTLSETPFEELRKQLPDIPLLSEVVHAMGGQLLFMIELKTIPSPEQLKILKEELKPLKPLNDYFFMSLQTNSLLSLKDWPKTCLVSIALTNIKEVYKETLKNHWGGFTGHYLLLNNSMNEKCHHLKIKTGTGFPDSKNSFYREVNRGVDWVFTNAPFKISGFKDSKRFSPKPPPLQPSKYNSYNQGKA